MIFAVLGDIRGDICALEAALEHIDASGIQLIMHSGNAVAGGDDGDAVVSRLLADGVRCVQGTEDRLLVRFSKKRTSLRSRLVPELYEAMERSYAATSSENLEFLRQLHKCENLEVDNIGITLSHGSPLSQSDQVGPGTPPARLRRLREASLSDIIICGGGAEPFATTVDGTLFVCPGALSCGPGRLRYALVTAESPPWSAEFPEMDYPS